MALKEALGAIGDGTIKGMIQSEFLIDTGKTCQIHSAPIYRRTRPKGKESEFCIACQHNERDKKREQVDIAYQNQAILSNGYNVFKRESIFSNELKKADFENFEIIKPIDDRAKNYGDRLIRDYIKGIDGNAIIQGEPGVGKSFLAMSIAKKLNLTYKDFRQSKSVIFVSTSMLVRLVQDSFKYSESKYSQDRITKLLIDCDILILDDLGKESSSGSTIKPAGDWTYRFLFNILDNRKSTIITTNFTVRELQQIYDKALVDRILKGSRDKIFVYPKETESKRS
ncbi:DNA replication protein [Streptococcus penaeicida]|uniref:DNA replication protein n=1 Tax=Streptococcus penaeicida TaxID=1765960 RepID=A0A2N8LBD0_9STRE|nr:ATP-binding protein [Streptococcus penaeicida]PND47459.1 DNA replication protein [Streptococcus penaeicida]